MIRPRIFKNRPNPKVTKLKRIKTRITSSKQDSLGRKMMNLMNYLIFSNQNNIKKKIFKKI